MKNSFSSLIVFFQLNSIKRFIEIFYFLFFNSKVFIKVILQSITFYAYLRSLHMHLTLKSTFTPYWSWFDILDFIAYYIPLIEQLFPCVKKTDKRKKKGNTSSSDSDSDHEACLGRNKITKKS
jgi:hypothetical protein